LVAGDALRDMSMLYYLAKITPEFAVEVRACPELVRGLFYGDHSLQRSDFEKKADIIDGNWLNLGRLASTLARPGQQPVEFVAQDTWLSKAVNGSGADDLGIELGYGPVWALTPHRVAEIAKGLKAESAALPAEPSPASAGGSRGAEAPLLHPITAVEPHIRAPQAQPTETARDRAIRSF
jgi:hypothetical protein